jgi:enamine deaminase RidA (YjgF/YER057c/UK114 family)
MTTWEYLTTPLLIHNTAAILNNWGKQGWELVQVVPGPEGGLVAYFKRPVGAGAPTPVSARPLRRPAVRGRGRRERSPARLAELGIELPSVVPPVAAYVPAKAHGDLVYTSGQLPMIGARCRRSARSAQTWMPPTRSPTRASARSTRSRRRRRSAGSIASRRREGHRLRGVHPEFTGQPGVINGASEVLGEIFGDAGRHARSAVGVPAAARRPVEVEVVFTCDDPA